MKKLGLIFFLNFASFNLLAMENNNEKTTNYISIEDIIKSLKNNDNLDVIKKTVLADKTIINKLSNKGQSLLSHAVLLNRPDIVKFFLEYDELLINRTDLFMGYTELHLAAFKGHAEILQLLLDRGGWEINLPTNSSMRLTALDLARQSNYHECCDILIANGANESVIK